MTTFITTLLRYDERSSFTGLLNEYNSFGLRSNSKLNLKLNCDSVSLAWVQPPSPLKRNPGDFVFEGPEGADVYRLPWLVHESPLGIHQSVIFCLFVSVPCEQRFLYCIAFIVYEVVRVACLSRG